MKKFFVSTGMVAIGAATLKCAAADDVISPKDWSVGATLRAFYDDNYNISSSSKGSFGIEFLPTVSLHVPLQQTDMGIKYTYGLYYYENRDEVGVNPFDQTHQVDLWVDHAFSERWHGKVTDTFAAGQEPELLNPNPVTANATPYRVNGDNISNHGAIALSTDWTRQFSSVLTYENNLYDYDNSGAMVVNNGSGPMIITPGGSGIGGASFAGLLDRVEENIALDLKWHIQPETTAFIGYQFSWINYTGNEPIAIIPFTTPTFNGVYHSSDRDNDSHYIYLGLEEEFTPNLTGMIRAGGTYMDVYADPLFPSTSWSPYADVSLSYTYTPGSYVQLGFTHDVNATDQVQPNNAGQITQYSESSVVYLDVNHRFTPKLVATAIGRVQLSTFQGGLANNADETDYSVGLNLNYQINPHLWVDLGYNYDNLVSDIVGATYTRNRVYLGLTANY